jgi:hypothetical protein
MKESTISSQNIQLLLLFLFVVFILILSHLIHPLSTEPLYVPYHRTLSPFFNPVRVLQSGESTTLAQKDEKGNLLFYLVNLTEKEPNVILLLSPKKDADLQTIFKYLLARGRHLSSGIPWNKEEVQSLRTPSQWIFLHQMPAAYYFPPKGYRVYFDQKRESWTLS